MPDQTDLIFTLVLAAVILYVIAPITVRIVNAVAEALS